MEFRRVLFRSLVAIHVPDVRTFGFVDEKGLATDGTEGSDRRIHAARNVSQRFGEELLGFGARRHSAWKNKEPRWESKLQIPNPRFQESIWRHHHDGVEACMFPLT